MLRKGVEAWNKWRDENPTVVPDLSGENLTKAHLPLANLTEANLHQANLHQANLHQANLTQANLVRANLSETNLSIANLRAILQRANLYRANLVGANLNAAILYEANLTEANLNGANLTGATLSGANLTDAVLASTNLTTANLTDANLTGARLHYPIFGSTELTKVKGLDRCHHLGPSIIDFQTLKNSGPLPIAFLRGIGLPDRLIEYLPSLLNEAIQFYSCFISYSSNDEAFAARIHADLQNKGVRCWIAPHDMPTGAKIIDALDEAIRRHDKVLLILSQEAIASDWVEGEVTRALGKTRTVAAPRKQVMPPNFVLLDASLPDVTRLVVAMVQAREAVESRSWLHLQEPTTEEWWADVLADPRARTRKRRSSEVVVERTLYRLADEPRETILVACSKCDWKAAYQRAELLAVHGPTCPMPSLLERLAAPGCPRLGSYWDRCGVHYVKPLEGG